MRQLGVIEKVPGVGRLRVIMILFVFFGCYCNAQTLVSSKVAVGEEITFLAGDGARLSGSLLLPKGGGPHPAVVVVIGSGSDSYRRYWDPERDSLDFPFFREISRIFLDHGFAVLFMEKRGINKSEGSWRKNSLSGRAEDVFYAIRYLKTRQEISPDQIGICGHSQRGWVAQTAGARYSDDVSFIVNLCGAVSTPKQQELDNLIQKQRCAGKSERALRRQSGWKKISLGMFGAISRLVKINHFSYVINDYKPEKVLPYIKCPFLAVYGETDDLVPVESNRAILVSEFAKSDKANYELVTIEQGTHGLFRAPHCRKWDEVQDRNLVPEFEPTLSGWLRKL